MSNTEKTTFQIPTQQELEQLSELHKAMGDYSRMRILWILMGQELCVSDLAKQMNITESAVSHQLRELRIWFSRIKSGKMYFTLCWMNISNGYWKKHMPTFQKGKMQPPFRISGRGLHEAVRY